MENSIESIWKNGFLNESKSILPEINNLYKIKSKQVVDEFHRRFRANLIAHAIAIPGVIIVYYIMGALWHGIVISTLIGITGIYGNSLMKSLVILEFGESCFNYLLSFQKNLVESTNKMKRYMRFLYPLYIMIVMDTIFISYRNQPDLMDKVLDKFPNMLFLWDIPIVLWGIAITLVLIFTIFSGKIYRWDINLIYGNLFRRLEELVSEMKQLKQEEDEDKQ